MAPTAIETHQVQPGSLMFHMISWLSSSTAGKFSWRIPVGPMWYVLQKHMCDGLNIVLIPYYGSFQPLIYIYSAYIYKYIHMRGCQHVFFFNAFFLKKKKASLIGACMSFSTFLKGFASCVEVRRLWCDVYNLASSVESIFISSPRSNRDKISNYNEAMIEQEMGD